jgi:hypothetical protein
MKRVLRTVLIALLATSVAFGIYVSVYYRATDAALSCLDDGDGARVKLVGNTYCIEAAGAADALVLYPGAKIQAEAYLPLLRRIAADGIDCYLVKMPFNLAVFGINRIEGVMKAYPHRRWFLAGHSLGGVMAAQWAAEHPGALDGLVLLAAYPAKKLPEDLPVLLLYGSEDRVLNQKNLEKSKDLLPSGALIEQLPGGNHAHFASYGEQRGDGPATIPTEEQWNWTAEWIGRLVTSDISS